MSEWCIEAPLQGEPIPTRERLNFVVSRSPRSAVSRSAMLGLPDGEEIAQLVSEVFSDGPAPLDRRGYRDALDLERKLHKLTSPC